MQIVVQKIWPNDQNKANGKFVGTDGRTYFIEARFHGRLFEGMTIDPPSAKPSEFNGKTNYWLPKGWGPPEQSQAAQPAPNGHVPQGTPAGHGLLPSSTVRGGSDYKPKDDDLITRLAILKSLIESGALLQGEQSMDDLVEMAWTTAPKLKVWQR
jgi:hypothetical protein